MYALDVAIAAALEGRHAPCARLRFLGPDGSVVATYEAAGSVLTGGQVSFDLAAASRRSGSIHLANPRGLLSPQGPGEPTFPGERLVLERGAIIGGSRAYALLATLRIARFTGTMAGTLSLDLEDVLQALAQPFGEVLTVDAGTPAGDVLRAAWEPVLGDSAAWSIDDGGRTAPARAFLEDEERLGAVAQLMRDLGLEVFSDRTGNVVLQPIPDPTAAASVRRFVQTAGQARLLDLARTGERQPYNRVVVIAERPDGSVLRAEASVTDPSSPIHADRIGLRTAPIHRSAQIPDQAAANAVAAALLVQYSLYQDSVGGTAVPALELDEGDVIEVVEAITGADDRYRLDRVTHPLVGGGTVLQATKVLPVFVSAS